MTQPFVFVGNPGDGASTLLALLKKHSLVPKRCDIGPSFKNELRDLAPVAVVFDPDLPDRENLVASLREERTLADVPLIIRAPSLDSPIIEQAFRDGMDEFIIDGCSEQFEALAAAVRKEASWGAVRAPAGQVILAHPERLERIQLGRVLRRNGYDTYFAASTDELLEALDKTQARGVVASTALPGRPLMSIVAEVSGRQGELSPWVIVAEDEQHENLQGQLGTRPPWRLMDANGDPESLTFLMNEMLAPPPVGARRSPRLLYSAPVTFKAEDSDVAFSGYTYNVNLGGLYIRSLTPLPLQSRIVVTFTPPNGRGTVVAVAQVCWVKHLGDTGGQAAPPGMGIQFLEMWPADDAGYERGYAVLLEESGEASNPSIPLPNRASPFAQPE